MFVACGIWCLADVSSVSPSSLLIKPIFSVLAHAEKQFFSELVRVSFTKFTLCPDAVTDRTQYVAFSIQRNSMHEVTFKISNNHSMNRDL